MRTSVASCAGLVLALLGSILVPTAASAAPTMTPQEFDPALRSLLTDVTGDGRYDKVDLSSAGTDRYRLTVTAAGSGRTSSVEFASAVPASMDADAALYGAANLDGVPGVEVIVQRWTRSATETSDAVDLIVYTWRGGKLVAEKAPKGGRVAGWHFGALWGNGQGYRFFDKGGHRYVEVSTLKQQNSGKFLWVGTITRSVWRKGHWVKVSTRKVKLTDAKAFTYLRYSGPDVLKTITTADIDGDSRPDELRFYTYQDTGAEGRYRVKVTTATGTVSSRRFYALTPHPLTGLSDFDGVAGAEILLYISLDSSSGEVLTWRNGKLTPEAAPESQAGRTPYTWPLGGDDSLTQVTLTVVDGVHHLDYLNVGAPWENDLTARVDHIVWQDGKWVTVSSDSYPNFTEEQFDALCSGFCGFPITKP
ncbi:hypothetical protein [Propionicimonas paludicola]|nr:hypothetical protein [Propionicimonas paludicola]